MLGTMMEFPLSLVHVLERVNQLFGAVEIVSRNPDRSLMRGTYADVYRRSRALAEALQRAGLRKGDRVATLMWNHQQHLEAYFGAPISGGVLHTLNLRLHPDDVNFIVRHAKDRFLIVDDVLLPLLEKCRGGAPFEKIIVVRHGTFPAPLPPDMIDYEEFLATATGDFKYPEIAESDACGLCYTSGTTGQCKGVVYTHRSTVLHSLCISLPDSLCLRQADSLLPVVPMFHVNAWGLPYACALTGAKLVMPGPHLDAVSLLDLIQGEKVTVGAGVPTIWLGILEALDKEPKRWSFTDGLRMVVGGSAAPASLIRGLDKHGMRVLHAWGMTEMSPVGTVATPRAEMLALPYDEQLAIRAKQGAPVPFVEVRAVDDAGRVMPWDGKSQGELQVRGPWVAASYYQMPAAQDRWAEDGWFKTGDVVTIDKAGFIEITDRSKDLIKSGGEWISSVALENALMGHPAVKEAAVIAVPHPRWAERPLAAVVLKQGAQATAEELAAFLGKTFLKYQVPDAFVFIDAVPRTSTGKFLKSALRERYRTFEWGTLAR